MAMENRISTAASTAPATRKNQKSMADYIKVMQTEIAKALPSVITPERFTRITLSAISANPQLADTTPKSFLAAMMTAAQLGVEPNTPLGQAYLIPYRNHGTLECQFQLGYKGLIDLAYRSGDVATIQAHAVYENDEFVYSFGLEPSLKHIPAMRDRGEPIAFYALWRGINGGYGFEVMSKADVDAHAARFSQAFRSGRGSPWQSNYEEMAKKTVLKKSLKYAPLKSDFVRAVASDESIKTELSDDMFSVPNETVEIELDAYEVGDPVQGSESDMEEMINA